MADFDIAADFVLTGGLVNEGGYEPATAADPGGETKYGISKRFHPNVDVRNLTVEGAKEIYRAEFWRFDEVKDQSVASHLLDVCVNEGRTGGMRLIEQSLVIFFPGKAIAIDGVFGPADLAMINACQPDRFLNELRARRAQRMYEDLRRNAKETTLELGLFRRACK